MIPKSEFTLHYCSLIFNSPTSLLKCREQAPAWRLIIVHSREQWSYILNCSHNLRGPLKWVQSTERYLSDWVSGPVWESTCCSVKGAVTVDNDSTHNLKPLHETWARANQEFLTSARIQADCYVRFHCLWIDLPKTLYLVQNLPFASLLNRYLSYFSHCTSAQ